MEGRKEGRKEGKKEEKYLLCSILFLLMLRQEHDLAPYVKKVSEDCVVIAAVES